MKKIIIGLFMSTIFSTVVFSQVGNSKTIEKRQIIQNVQNSNKEFSTEEIGKYHNYVLDILRTNKVNLQDEQSVSDLLNENLPKLDKRFTNEAIKNALKIYSSDDFRKYLEDLIKRRGGPGDYNPNYIEKFQNDVITNLITSNKITENFSKIITKVSKLNIDEFNKVVSRELNNNNFTKDEKYYLSVYSSIYNASYNYWNTVKLPSEAGDPARLCWWCSYAADAAGGLVGLAASPAGSIVLGAACSAVANRPTK